MQQLANIQERKRPGTIIGCEPAVGIEIKFSLNRAGRAVEPTQILLGLVENSGRQILLSCLARAIVGGVHIVVRLFIPFSSFRRPTFQKISAWAACLALAPPVGFCGRIKAEQEDDQKEDDWSYAHGCLVIGKKPPRRGVRAERRAMDLRLQNSKKSPILAL